MGEEEESIEQAAAVRRERLRALKAAQELLSAPEDQDKPDDANPTMEEEWAFTYKFYMFSVLQAKLSSRVLLML